MNVFISYAREDRDHADKLSSALEARGWSVWWDPRIPAGQSFDETIERELETADCVVVMWSKHSILSEWVKNEASAALDRGVLIPALIDDIKPPLAFRRRQAADLVGWNGDASHAGFRALCDSIARMVSRPAAASSTDRVVRPTPRLSWSRPRILASIAVTAVLLVLGYFVLWRLAPAGEATSEQKASMPTTTVGGRAEGSASSSSLPGNGLVASAGVFEFNWPGSDCWKIYRGDVEAKSSCGGGRHALQVGTYLVKPSSSAVFEPFSVRILIGQTTSAP